MRSPRSRNWWARTAGWAAPQSRPFALAPVEFALPSEPIVGAVSMHRLMRRWLVDLGHPSYGTDDPHAGDASLVSS